MSETQAKRQRGARILGLGFLAVFVLLCALAALGYFALRGTPEYYTQQQERIAAMSPEQRVQVSESFFNRLAKGWSAGPDNATSIEQLIGHRSTIEMPYEEINIWLAEEGVELLEGVGISMPKSVQGAMVDSAGSGLLRISCDLKRRDMNQVVAMTFDIHVDDDGQVTSTLKGATAGVLPIPTHTAIDLIAKRAKGDMMLDLMQGTPVGPIELPIDPSDDGLRDGRLVGLKVRDDALIITRETVRRKPKTDVLIDE